MATEPWGSPLSLHSAGVTGAHDNDWDMPISSTDFLKNKQKEKKSQTNNSSISDSNLLSDYLQDSVTIINTS